MPLRLALKEIRNNPRFAFFFVLNLALGLVGFLMLDAFKSSIEENVARRSKDLLTADLAVAARRVLTPQELSALSRHLPPGTTAAEMAELYSMVATPKRSRLAQVRAVEGTFPFYGELKLRGKARAEKASALEREPLSWISADLARQLELREGDSIKLGTATFTVAAVIDEDSSAVGQLMALAPRIYVGLAQLPRTRLLQEGSTAWYTRLYAFPDRVDVEALAGELDKALPDPAIRVQTHSSSSEQVGRLSKYLNDYLGLASLIAFFLAAVGAGYLFRNFLYRRLKDTAILISLGMAPRAAQGVYLAQLLILSVMAVVPAAIGAAIMLPWLTKALQALFPFSLSPEVRLSSVGISLLLSILGNFLFSLPLLRRLGTLKPASLFQEGARPSLVFRAGEAFWFLPAVVFFLALSIWLAKSWRVGGLFVLSLIVVIALLLGAGGFALSRLENRLERLRLVRKLAFRNLARHKLGTLSSLLAIGLGVGLINLIALTQASLRHEIQAPEQSAVPSLFLFDIQDDQVEPLKQFYAKKDLREPVLSPMIRARLESVNGVPFEKDFTRDAAATREAEVERRFRNRGINLTYRPQLFSSETIVDGVPVREGEDPPGISVEKEFAKRLDLALGDKITVDIQGVRVEGVVRNFRKIKWTSFQPNFFLQFGAGVLEDAPKTFLASVPPLATEAKNAFQDDLVREFPNVSAVDVSQVVDRILGIIVQMSWALQLMAYLSLFTGLVVLFSIANHQAQQRRWDTALLKVLGASFSDVRAVSRWEFFGIGVAAAALGILSALGLTVTFSYLVFDNAWNMTWGWPALTFLFVPLACVVTSELATRKSLAQSPILLLQQP